ncbi:MAG: DUF4114 domain-containing protein [Gammaproteobacteria bacterium]|nr:DUF4114 domain-containing protein [Gammaproteobacteria bacterium]
MLNKTIILTLFLFQFIILTNAQATTIYAAPGNEKSIESILDNYAGSTSYTRIDDNNDIIWGTAQGRLTSIRVIGKQAGFNNIFGITKTDGTDFIGLIAAGVIEDSINNNESIDILNILYSDYLLAILTPQHNLFTSNPGQNGDTFDHMVTWYDNNNPNRYFVGFEDLYNGGDKDYNDVVLELIYSNSSGKNPDTNQIPEPHSIVLLGLGLIAFSLSGRRRKRV